jgi:hypothetical protein
MIEVSRLKFLPNYLLDGMELTIYGKSKHNKSITFYWMSLKGQEEMKFTSNVGDSPTQETLKLERAKRASLWAASQ